MIKLIAAVDVNFVIGKDNTMPWYYKSDLARFKMLTTDNTVIMGYKTWESLKCKPLSKRDNFILSKSKSVDAPAQIKHTYKDAIDDADKSKIIWVIGGQEVFNMAFMMHNSKEPNESYKINEVHITHLPIAIDQSSGNIVKFPLGFLEKDFIISSSSKDDNDGSIYNIYVPR